MNTYALLGHGCDIVSEGAAEGTDDKIVPPGCIYITLAVCGFISWDLYKLIVAFKDKSIYNELMNPNENKKKLEEYFKLTPGDQHTIHIHNPGDTYNDANIYFITNGKFNETTFLAKSGIYKLGNIPDISPKFAVDSMLATIRTRGTIAYTKEMIKSVYNGSLILPENLEDEYPSIEDFMDKYSNMLVKSLSELMSLQKGIYYNFSCRVPCNRRMSHTRFRRVASAAKDSVNDVNALEEPKRISVQEREGPNPIRQSKVDEWLFKKLEIIKEQRIEEERIKQEQIEKQRRRRNLYKKLKASRGTTAKKKGLKGSKTGKSLTRRRSFRRQGTPRQPMNTN